MNFYSLLTGAEEFFSWIGVIIITAGAVWALFIFFNRSYSKGLIASCAQARIVLCHSIVFGLEFMVVADIMKSILVPDITNTIILGSLVLMRSVLGYTLSVELKNLEK
jgi:uncharacterized membrane protein